MNLPIVLLFTSNYPFNKGEEFLENELPVLSTYARHIYIFPDISGDRNTMRPLPSNVTVIELNVETYNRWRTISNDAILLLSLASKLPFNRLPIKKIKYQISALLRDQHKSLMLQAWLQEHCKNENIVLYTYWLNTWATRLSILKKKKVIKNFISRVHGFDLYHEVNPFGYIPNRSFQLQLVDKVYSVSKKGMNYLKERYPLYQSKIEYSYLGTKDSFSNQLLYNDVFTVLSCSSLNAIKRVHLIIEALTLLDIPVRWIHIGDGDLRSSVESLARKLPANVSYEFKGHLQNRDVMKYYQENFHHLFINVSSSEGLPVSVMEAMSFGIPVVATNVGGQSEIVNETNGFLLEPSFKPSELASIIQTVYEQLNSAAYSQMRERVRANWERNFKAETNYADFFKKIMAYSYRVS